MPTATNTATLDALEMLETLERLAQMSDFEVSDEYDQYEQHNQYDRYAEPLPRPAAAEPDWGLDAQVMSMSSGSRPFSLPALPSDSLTCTQDMQHTLHTLPALQEEKGDGDKSDPWTWWNELKTREMR